MFHIIGFLFLLLFLVLIIGLLVLSKIIGLVFGFKRRMQGRNSTHRTARTSQDSSYQNRRNETDDTFSTQGDAPVRQRKKIFDKDEGEYVEFEEIK